MKFFELTPVFAQFVPNRKDLEEGKLYISKEYNSSSHLCPCGCKELVVIPFKDMRDDFYWGYKEAEGKVTFEPSISNNQLPCKSHYYIRDNKIIWA